MFRQHGKATAAPTATDTTPVITVDPVNSTHRALFPGLLDRAAYVVAVYRDNQLADVDAIFGVDATAIPMLQQRAVLVASQLGGAYWQGCDYCGINCAPADRAEHEHMNRGSETAHWIRWAA